MPPWEKVKGICQPCRTLLCADQPFDCNRANGSVHWMCQSCAEDGDPTSISAGRVEKLGTCSFPIKPSKEEKNAFIAFASIYGKSARESDGGHLAAARSKQQESETSNAGSAHADISEPSSRIVTLKIGHEAALNYQEKVTGKMPKSVGEDAKWTSVVNRPPTPPESIMDIPDNISASVKPSPLKSSFPDSPTTNKRPDLAVVIPLSRHGSDNSRKSAPDVVTTEDDGENSSAVTSTPRKRRRLHRGLKERPATAQANEDETSEPSAPILRRASTFQTDEEILAKFTKSAVRRQSDGTSSGHEAVNPSLQDVQTPPPVKADSPIKHSSSSPSARELDEVPILPIAPSTDLAATSPVENKLLTSDKAPIEILDIQSGQNEFRPMDMPAPDPAATTEIIDLDSLPDADALDAPLSEGLVQREDTLDTSQMREHDIETQEGSATSPNEAENTVQIYNDSHSHGLSEISPEQTQRPSKDAQASLDGETQQTVQQPVSYFTNSVFQEYKVASSPVSPMDVRQIIDDVLQPRPKLVNEAAQVTDGLSQRILSEGRRSVGNSDPQNGVPLDPPIPEKQRSQSGSPRKRSFPTDYLEQMLDSSKRSRTGSQSSDTAYQNSFTPINNPSFGSFQTLSSQSADSKPKAQVKAKAKPRRRPKGPDPNDLRRLAPAPIGNEPPHLSMSTLREPEQHVWNANYPIEPPTNTLQKQDAASRPESRMHSYPFLNHRRNTSSNERTVSPPNRDPAPMSKTPPSAQRNVSRPTGSPYQRQAVLANSHSPKTRAAPQGIRYGPAALPSPADSDFNVRPDLDHNDIFNRYPHPQMDQPMMFEHHQRPQEGVLRRHSTQVELSTNNPPSAVMPNLNRPLPSQMIASGTYHNPVIHRGDPAPSQVFSAPLTPTEAYQSPQPPRYPQLPHPHPPQPSPLSVKGQDRIHPGDLSVNNTALRTYTEKAEIHVYPPSADGEDFEIVSLGPYSGADSFVRQVLSTIPEYAARVAKLRINLTWMPDGYKGRSLKMQLDDQPRKELAFKYVTDKVADNFKVAGPDSNCVLDVDVILKEGPK